LTINNTLLVLTLEKIFLKKTDNLQHLTFPVHGQFLAAEKVGILMRFLLQINYE
jgi:hypothetical protein